MKILHTSDWHIGKKLMGRDRFDEFRTVLDEISSIVKAEKVELVLIAGDVFDTYTPAAEAEEIFYGAVKNISQSAAVLIISGNHDDYVRLAAASPLAQEQGVYIVGNNLKQIKCAKIGGCYPVESDCGYVIFENLSGERVYVNTLPYPNEMRFKEGKTDESFEEKMKRWIDFGQRGNVNNYPSIFLSHIFVAGGSVSDSEREIDLGGTRAVGLNLLPNCDYCALGHLHKRQRLGKNAYYSGAIMQFSFDECGSKKSLNIIDLTQDGVKNFTQTELKSYKKLMRLQADGVELALTLLSDNKDAYIELTLNIGEPLSPSQSSALRAADNLISLKANVSADSSVYSGISRKDKSSAELFNEYYKSKYSIEPSAELLSLFLSMTEEE